MSRNKKTSSTKQESWLEWVKGLEPAQLIGLIAAFVAIQGAIVSASIFFANNSSRLDCEDKMVPLREKITQQRDEISDLKADRNRLIYELQQCISPPASAGSRTKTSPDSGSNYKKTIGTHRGSRPLVPNVVSSIRRLSLGSYYDFGREIPSAAGVTVRLLGFNETQPRTRATLLVTDIDGPQAVREYDPSTKINVRTRTGVKRIVIANITSSGGGFIDLDVTELRK